MPKNSPLNAVYKSVMRTFKSLAAPYTPHTRKSKSKSKNKSVKRGGGKKNWKNFSKKLIQKEGNKRVASGSTLKASASNWSPPNHVLRVPKESNKNFTRRENKKMANELFNELRREHKTRRY